MTNMRDPRDSLFSRLHSRHLKPRGFRKNGRVSCSRGAEGLITSAVLESAPSAPHSTRRFGINLRASHPSFPANRILLNLSLRQHAERIDRWTYEPDTPTEPLFEQVETVFVAAGLGLLERMASVEGLALLLEELDEPFLSESRAWCLDHLGQRESATESLRSALARAPHEAYRQRLLQVLAERETNVA